MNRCRKILLIVTVSILLAWTDSTETLASTPRLDRIVPGGMQLGSEQVVTFHGQRLNDAEEILFYDSGISVVELKPLKPRQLQVKLKIHNNCRIGEHVVQVRTRSGVSDYRLFYVEAYPSVAESEPNDSLEIAQKVLPVEYDPRRPDAEGVVVAAVADAQDIDWYCIDCRKDQRLSLEIVGMRLGHFCDTELSLHAADGTVVAMSDDSPASGQDPVLSVKISDDGQYLIRVANAIGKGSANDRYRLHVGNFPRPVLAVPAVAAEGQSTPISFLGDAEGTIEADVTLSQHDVLQGGALVSDDRGTTPTPVRMSTFLAKDIVLSDTLGDLNLPKNMPRTNDGKTHALPFNVESVITKEREFHFRSFFGTKGQSISIHCMCNQLGSPMDPIIQLRGSNNKPIATNDDAGGTDSSLRHALPADDVYLVRVWDVRGAYGPLNRYQLTVEEVKPNLSLGIKQVEPYSQLRQQIAVHRGNRFAAVMTLAREQFDSAVQIEAEDLPEGIDMSAAAFPESQSEVPVVFEADASLGLTGSLTDFHVVAKDSESGKSVVGTFLNHAPLMRIQPGNMVFKYGNVDRLAVAVLEEVPFSIELTEIETPLTRGGQLKLRVNIHRDEGFAEPITLKIPYRSPGVNAVSQIVAKPDRNAVDFPVNATQKALLGDWPICVTGESTHKGPVVVSTQLRKISVIQPTVLVESKPVKARQNEAIEVNCDLQIVEPFDGEATLQLVGLPSGAQSEPVKFTAVQDSLMVSVQTGEKTRPGNYPAIACQVTIPHKDQSITFDAGKVSLRVAKAK